MFGLTEIILILLVIGIVSIFGRKTIKKLAKDFFGVKQDIEDIQEEVKLESKKEKK